MRLMFYSPSYKGHHFAYLARMLPAFVRLPIEIHLVTTPEAIASDEFQRTLAPFASRLKLSPICTPAPRPPFKNSRHRLRELRAAIEQVQPDHVAVCYADGLWQLAVLDSLVGRRPWRRDLPVEAWIYRTRFGDRHDRRWKSRAERWLFKQLMRRQVFAKVHADGELLFEYAKSLASRNTSSVVLTPNPVVVEPLLATADARRALNLPVEGRWISLSGVIARYKGADLLLHACDRLWQANQAAAPRLLLIGPHEQDIRDLLATPAFKSHLEAGRLASIDRIVNEHEMFLAAAASDLVLAPYPRHEGRSSIILWAAAAGRPSLGADAGVIGYVIRQEQLGSTCQVLDTGELARSISQALAMPWTDADVERVRRYAAGHQIENYQDVASQLVRSRLAAQEPPSAGDHAVQ